MVKDIYIQTSLSLLAAEIGGAVATVLDQEVFELLFRNGLVTLTGGGRAILFGDIPVLRLQNRRLCWLYKELCSCRGYSIYTLNHNQEIYPSKPSSSVALY